jgi:hypothetical protein
MLAHRFSLIEHEKVQGLLQGLFRPSLETKLPVSAMWDFPVWY